MKLQAPLVAILALVAGCSRDSGECRDGSIEECTDGTLPQTDSGGAPWPTLGQAMGELRQACPETSCERRRQGVCADGKVFIDRNGGFTGQTLYFRGDALVGSWSWGDVGFCVDDLVCWGGGQGDTRCVEVQAEALDCPCGSESADGGAPPSR